MTDPLLVFDCHYLCHRAYHTTGDLSFQSKPTGVIYGFLKSIQHFKDEFQTDRVAFCFEGSNLKRSKIFPGYKQKRRKEQSEWSVEEQKCYSAFKWQVRQLETNYLPQIGFKNIFNYDGYESDDVMAVLAQDTDLGEVILITADQDLFQCITQDAWIYSPQQHKRMNLFWFKKEYGIHPSQWSLVKGIAGCKTDEVPGVPGVGEKTAIKWIKGLLKEDSKINKAIKAHTDLIRFNRELVELPYFGCPWPQIKEDEIDRVAWREVCRELGIRALQEPPMALRHRQRGFNL